MKNTYRQLVRFGSPNLISPCDVYKVWHRRVEFNLQAGGVDNLIKSLAASVFMEGRFTVAVIVSKLKTVCFNVSPNSLSTYDPN